jgi:glyoxylase-like metal-dependent hydrolase (beta-lactamase superfamily II)
MPQWRSWLPGLQSSLSIRWALAHRRAEKPFDRRSFVENLVIITVKSTHFYLVDVGKGMLLVDAGWVDAFKQFEHQLKAYKIPYSEIKYVMMTHHHPDHAGLIQTVKRLSGARQLIPAGQLAYLQAVTTFHKNMPEFEPLELGKRDVVNPDRAMLRSLGIHGEIIPTPGHSPDSVSLVMDSGAAFVGDLRPLGMVGEENAAEIQASWQRLVDHGAQEIYPAHGEPYAIDMRDISA